MAIPQQLQAEWIVPWDSDPGRDPLVTAAGTILTGGGHGLLALSPDGTERWRAEYPVQEPVGVGPGFLVADATAERPEHVGGDFVGLNLRGMMLWGGNYAESAPGPAAVRSDGVILVPAGGLYAVTGRGRVLWHVPGLGATSIALAADDTAYVNVWTPDGRGDLVRVSREGSVLWRRRFDVSLYAAPAVGSGGTVYVISEKPQQSSKPPRLLAVTPEGEVKWRKRVRGDIAVAIAPDGTIYACTRSALRAFRPSGVEKWRVPLKAGGAPVIDGSGTVLVPVMGRSKILAISPAGKRLPMPVAGLKPSMRPVALAIGADGRLVASFVAFENRDLRRYTGIVGFAPAGGAESGP